MLKLTEEQRERVRALLAQMTPDEKICRKKMFFFNNDSVCRLEDGRFRICAGGARRTV